VKLRTDQKQRVLLKGKLTNPVTCCSTVPDCPLLFVGHSSGSIAVYYMTFDSSKGSINVLQQPTYLYGHQGPITIIRVCLAFGVFVSASLDGTCILWDLNSLSYVRSIRPEHPVQLVAMSNVTGDIAIVIDSGEQSTLQLYNINCRLNGEISTQILIHSLCFSCAPEGISVNVIATGMENGQIQFWSTWDLTPVSVIETEKFTLPVTSVTFSADSQHLYATNSDGVLVIWGNRELDKPPKYHSLP